MTLPGVLGEARLLVCVGSGGVGKTTTAASLGLAAALRGRRVLVLTIDPARRLANALGLPEIGNHAVRIPVEGAPGELWAMMLDARATFDAVIARVAGSDATREAILQNRVYRAIAGSFSGSQEYMAAEQVYDVVHGGQYDLVVLDTPPVKNALDFLDAPSRLARFLDRQVMRWFMVGGDEPALGRRFLAGTSTVVYRLLGHVFGREFLADMATFFGLFKDLYEGFRARHEAVSRLFSAPGTAFLVVAAPREPSLDVARYFLAELVSRRMAVAGLGLAQVHDVLAGTAAEDEAAAAALDRELRARFPALAAALGEKLRGAHREVRDLAAAEAKRTERIHGELPPGAFLVRVPKLDAEVNDLDGLQALHAFLLPSWGPPPGRRGPGYTPASTESR